MTQGSNAEHVRQAVQNAQVRKAKAKPNGHDAHVLADGEIWLQSGDSVTLEPVRWIWQDYLARGKLHLLCGPPEAGKTTIALAMATTITRGGKWPDGTQATQGNVLIWSGEDDVADTLAPRLTAMGADMRFVQFVRGTMRGGKVRSFDPAADMPALTAAASALGKVRMLLVDPVVLAVRGDSHKNAEVRAGLQPLVDLGQQLDAVVVGISHLVKASSGRDIIERVIGSIAFSAVARIVLMAAKVKGPDGVERRIFTRGKSNLGPSGDGFEYHLTRTEAAPGIFTGAATWGQALQGEARDLLADLVPGAEEAGPRETDEMLLRVLSEDMVPAKTVIAQMKAEGFSEKQTRRARERLQVVSQTTGFGNEKVTYWKLPHTSRKLLDSIRAQDSA